MAEPPVEKFIEDLGGQVAEALARDLGVLCQKELVIAPPVVENQDLTDLLMKFTGGIVVAGGTLSGEIEWSGFLAVDTSLAAAMCALMIMTPDEEIPEAVAAGMTDEQMDAFGEIANQMFASYAGAAREFFEAEISPENQPPKLEADGGVDPELVPDEENMIIVTFATTVGEVAEGNIYWAMPVSEAEHFKAFVLKTVAEGGQSPAAGASGAETSDDAIDTDEAMETVTAGADALDELEPPQSTSGPEGTMVEAPAKAPRGDELSRILKIQVPVAVRVAEKEMTVDSVLNLQPGFIVEFDKDGDEPLDLTVNNNLVAIGEAVKIGEKFGIRLIRVADVRDTIRNLGG